MAPLQIIILLLIARLPKSLAAATNNQLPSFNPFHLPPWLVILSFLLSHLIVVLIVAQRTRAALKILDHPNASSVAVTARTDSLFQYARWITIGLTALHIYLLGLPTIVHGFLDATPLRHIPLLPEFLFITPTLLSWVAFWAANYRVECVNRERSLPTRLASGLPAHHMPTLKQFLFMHVRHNFYILVPVTVATLIEEVATRVEPWVPHASGIGILLALLTLLLMMPWFITHAWHTVPLTGPLRNKLDTLANQYRLRFRNILIWKTHNAITNAAILGYLPYSRYFLMTDALLETLTDQQLEAVFAHEVGHGVHKHIWWYLTGIFAAMLFSTAIADIASGHLLPQALLHMLGGEVLREPLGLVLGLTLIALFITFGFPFVSHRFEHQADWFAARHMAQFQKTHPTSLPIPAKSLMGPPPDLLDEAALTQSHHTIPILAPALSAATHVHAPLPKSESHAGAATLEVPESAAATSVTLKPEPAGGAELFISALDHIADLAHRSRNKKGWMHPSINHRMTLLRTLAHDPLAQKSFHRKMTHTRLYVLAFFTLAVALTLFSATHPAPKPTSPATTPTPTATAIPTPQV